jgi:putative chitinase
MDRPTLQRFLPTIDADLWLIPLDRAIEDAQLTTTAQLADFLAQCAHESTGFGRLTESMAYSEQGLLATFPGHFTPTEARKYAHRAQDIGNRVYAGRMGNGPESSGDGYLYRGRGLIQITGRDNYRDCSRALRDSDELLRSPDVLIQPLFAARSAAWYWTKHGCTAFADSNDFEGLTRRINGGLNGLKSRLEWRARAYKALGAEVPA